MDLGFDDLVLAVEQTGSDASSLEKLSAASSISSALADHADALLGHFVELCRKDGRSWAEIGAALGVTKQAAQKRFVEMPLGRVTPRTRKVLETARALAEDQGASAVRLDHLSLAIFSEPDSIGARILRDLGIQESELDSAIATRSRTRGANLAADTAADQAVIASALERGHNYVATEHILLACHRDPSSLMAGVLDSLGASKSVIEEKVDAALEPAR